MEILLVVLLQSLLAIAQAQDFLFPALDAEDEKPGKQPPRLTDSRYPVNGKCPENQLLYPGDQAHDWVCDCGPGFIYYPIKNACYPAYRKGPCKEKEYLILPKNEVIPECTENPCQPDGFVRYQNKCYELNTDGGPCKPAKDGGGIFGINTTTLELECLTDTDRLSLINFPSNCPPGSRRGATNCRPEYKRK